MDDELIILEAELNILEEFIYSLDFLDQELIFEEQRTPLK